MSKKKTTDKDRVVTVRLPDDWYEYLRSKAFHDRESISDLIRDALRQQFSLQPPSPPDDGSKGGIVYGSPGRHNLAMADGE
jgi:hypothetical protein